jgi:hypothetical protein
MRSGKMTFANAGIARGNRDRENVTPFRLSPYFLALPCLAMIRSLILS